MRTYCTNPSILPGLLHRLCNRFLNSARLNHAVLIPSALVLQVSEPNFSFDNDFFAQHSPIWSSRTSNNVEKVEMLKCFDNHNTAQRAGRGNAKGSSNVEPCRGYTEPASFTSTESEFDNPILCVWGAVNLSPLHDGCSDIRARTHGTRTL